MKWTTVCMILVLMFSDSMLWADPMLLLGWYGTYTVAKSN